MAIPKARTASTRSHSKPRISSPYCTYLRRKTISHDARVAYLLPHCPHSKYAHSSATRKTATLGYEGKTLSNAPLLVEIVKLRQQAAELLGYPNHAAYILEEKMAKTPETVLAFLDDLRTRLTPIAEKEKERLLELKKEVAEKTREPYEHELYLWDTKYLDRLFVERNLKIGEWGGGREDGVACVPAEC